MLAYSVLDGLPASPVTEAAAGRGGLPVLTLAQAAVERSDNLAANLLLARFGGPPAVTAFWRSLGDRTSRLDNKEPEMNHVAPGQVHDTTTPLAMAVTVSKLLTRLVLSGEARARLWAWMKAAPTGLNRLRAGLPAGWVAGDKTGSMFGGQSAVRVNDLALALAPPGDSHFRAPVAVTAYYEPAGTPDLIRPQDEAVLAAVMRIATDPLAWKANRR